MGGISQFNGRSVVVIGHQKGADAKEMAYRNFGMPHPEGYRKALRLMNMAEVFRKPILTMIDTPGAFPGVGAEERGQAEAIARNLRRMILLRTPIIAIVIGEGGSGGALAIGIGDRILMLEYSIYSVISPEGCAAILWKDGGKGKVAAESLKLTAPDLYRLGVIDEIVKEPLGGAHRNPQKVAEDLREAIGRHLSDLEKMDLDDLLKLRYEKFRKMGSFIDGGGG
jgi:acetyl-CoA carboxylase carboxyl transferase subunit alpha